MIVFSAVLFGGLLYFVHGVYRTWYPGPISTDIAEYQAMRGRFGEIYPWAPDFLPVSIPASASDVSYEAFPYSVMQGTPYLELGFTLSPEDAEAEHERLRSLHPDIKVHSDFQHDFTFTDTSSRSAHASYDPLTYRFEYRINSD